MGLGSGAVVSACLVTANSSNVKLVWILLDGLIWNGDWSRVNCHVTLFLPQSQRKS